MRPYLFLFVGLLVLSSVGAPLGKAPEDSVHIFEYDCKKVGMSFFKENMDHVTSYKLLKDKMARIMNQNNVFFQGNYTLSNLNRSIYDMIDIYVQRYQMLYYSTPSQLNGAVKFLFKDVDANCNFLNSLKKVVQANGALKEKEVAQIIDNCHVTVKLLRDFNKELVKLVTCIDR
jgi:hypothetical protein